MNRQSQMQKLINILEDHLPPYLIEEVRGQMLDIITSIP